MQLPPQLHLALAPSPRAALVLVALGTVLAATAWAIPAPTWARLLAMAAFAAWTVDRLRVHALRVSSRSVVEIAVAGDLLIVVRYADGRTVAGTVRPASFVHPRLTSIVWRPDGARAAQALPILPDMLLRDDFRRLRILLRYGHNRTVAGAPASQA
jgi:hypothetical protein